MKLRAGRITTRLGGYGFDIKLPTMRTNDQVYWGVRGNSYVTDGESIYSINGIGEIRWKVEEWNREEESNAARAYFFEV